MLNGVRRLRENALRLSYGRRGMPRLLNGVPLRVRPEYRWQFSPAYDAAAVAYVRRRTRCGDTCVSVGANVGFYPLQLAAWAGVAGRVIACEPNPQTAAVLADHIRMNALQDRIAIVPKAVSQETGRARFQASGTNGMSRLGEANPLVADGMTLDLATITLDDLRAERAVRFDVIVMDIEGFEIAALSAARTVLAERPSVVLVELHPDAWVNAGTTRDGLEKLLAECRMKAIPLSGQRDPLGEYGHVALQPCEQSE